jgi:antitoxin component YwqK of YwqJK toxin-antitoxin module
MKRKIITLLTINFCILGILLCFQSDASSEITCKQVMDNESLSTSVSYTFYDNEDKIALQEYINGKITHINGQIPDGTVKANCVLTYKDKSCEEILTFKENELINMKKMLDGNILNNIGFKNGKEFGLIEEYHQETWNLKSSHYINDENIMLNIQEFHPDGSKKLVWMHEDNGKTKYREQYNEKGHQTLYEKGELFSNGSILKNFHENGKLEMSSITKDGTAYIKKFDQEGNLLREWSEAVPQ